MCPSSGERYLFQLVPIETTSFFFAYVYTSQRRFFHHRSFRLTRLGVLPRENLSRQEREGVVDVHGSIERERVGDRQRRTRVEIVVARRRRRRLPAAGRRRRRGGFHGGGSPRCSGSSSGGGYGGERGVGSRGIRGLVAL